MATEYVPYSGAVVTREQARERGLAHFFTNEPCIRQHIAQRYTSTGACLECQRLYLAKARTKERARKDAEPDYHEKRLAAQRVRQKRWAEIHQEEERERSKRRRTTDHFKAQQRAWAADHRDETNTRNRARYELTKGTNPEKLKEKWRADYWRDPAKHAANTKAWQKRNPEKHQAYLDATKEIRRTRAAQWARDFPEKAAAKTRRWQERNPGQTQRWRKENPEADRAIKQARRARERGAEGRHTKTELKALFAQQGGKCIYCEIVLSKSYCADHIVPLSRGGTNWITNIQLLCRSCNARKWAIDPAEFARRRKASR